MRIYLDACCLQRPFDDQTQPRIRVETEAVLAILAAVEAGEVKLLGSEALEFEISQIPDEQRRIESLAMLSLAKERLVVDTGCEELANSFEQAGLTAMDALHLAMASEASADFFVTADDRSLSGILCARHTMTTRSQYANPEETEEARGGHAGQSATGDTGSGSGAVCP